MLRKNVMSLLEQLKVCIFAETVFGVRCTFTKNSLLGLVTTRTFEKGAPGHHIFEIRALDIHWMLLVTGLQLF